MTRQSLAFFTALFCLSSAALAAGENGNKVHFNTIDLNRDGLIVPEEMTAWRAAKFATRDLDGDGVIDREELMKEANDGARAMTWDEASAFFMSFDRSGDLQVTLDEVKRAIERSYFFEMIDFNGSGGITRSEAKGWLDVSAPPQPKTSQSIPAPEIPGFVDGDPGNGGLY